MKLLARIWILVIFMLVMEIIASNNLTNCAGVKTVSCAFLVALAPWVTVGWVAVTILTLVALISTLVSVRRSR